MNALSPISRLQLEHFKPFREAQDIPIRPITLVYGPNSAGKSSILQSILLLAHALQSDSVHDACLQAAPGAPDLGGLKNFSYRNDLAKPVTIRVRLEPGVWSGLSQVPPTDSGLIDLNYINDPANELLVGANDVFDCTFAIRSGFSFHLNGRLLIKFSGPEHHSLLVGEGRRSTFPDDRSFPDRNDPFGKRETRLSCFGDEVDFDHEVVRNWIAQQFLAKTGEDMHHDMWASACAAAREEFQTRVWMYGILPIHVSWDNAYRPEHLVAGEEQQPPKATLLIFACFEEFVFRLIQVVRLRLNDLVATPIYLGPLRSYTGRRAMNLSSVADHLSANGDFTSTALISNPKTLSRVNEWLERRLDLRTSCRLVIREYFESEKARREFNRRKKEMANSGYPIEDNALHSLYECHGVLLEVSLKDIRSGVYLSQRDVGVGISQVLPILVAAIGTRNKWHIVEQPELHLHPAQQAELADLFIDSALGPNTNRLLIETHSEHLLLRLMKRIREHATGTADSSAPPITCNDVAVLYVEPGANGSVVRQMKLNARGELVSDWPGGFFEEGLRELLI